MLPFPAFYGFAIGVSVMFLGFMYHFQGHPKLSKLCLATSGIWLVLIFMGSQV